MKKIISLALVLLMIFSISLTVVSCGKDNDDPPDTSDGGNSGNTEGNGNTNNNKDTYEGTRPITLPST